MPVRKSTMAAVSGLVNGEVMCIPRWEADRTPKPYRIRHFHSREGANGGKCRHGAGNGLTLPSSLFTVGIYRNLSPALSPRRCIGTPRHDLPLEQNPCEPSAPPGP